MHLSIGSFDACAGNALLDEQQFDGSYGVHLILTMLSNRYYPAALNTDGHTGGIHLGFKPQQYVLG
jgi:hypothetical protein